MLERHPQMADRLNEIRIAIERPERVNRSATHAHREVCYRRPSPDRSRLRIVVHYRPVPPQGTWVGEVITAHPTERIDPKEEPLWP